ncbi:MAG: cytochrome c biogenesis protein CcdA [Saprospiraceae bacterium]|jgi:thiol:disulfide interchange protein DsbD
MKFPFSIFILFIISSYWTNAQILNPVKWNFEIRKVSGDEYKIIYTAKIDKGWTVYSQYTSDDGPVPTSVNYDDMSGIKLIGKATESGKRKEGMDPFFGVNVIKFTAEKPFVIEQKIKVTNASKPIIGYVNFMACDNEKCLPPSDVEFSLKIPWDDTVVTTPGKEVPSENSAQNEQNIAESPEKTNDNKVIDSADLAAAALEDFRYGAVINGDKIDQQVENLANSYKTPLSNCGGTEEKKEGLFWTFIFGFIGGLLALLTPCVFPMLPITISFFTKDTKRKGWVNGLIYGASIIVIYVLIGLLITIFVGPEALNRLSTNWIANTLFFVIFIAFAFSFFGFYEITLPGSWSTGSDRLADRGGLIGIFFMAFTLALVSFSCTGPIIGTAIVQAATKGEYMGPFLVMFGFSTALALPFGLFATFPAWLNTLPKSGSWMNSVKVVLGFLELALAFKFLSVADMTNGWGFLRYELFMGLWVLIFAGMALYLFGFIRFPHDSPVKKLSSVRIGFGIGAIVLLLYLLSGFRVNDKTGDYHSLALMSGLAPPAHYNFFIKPQEVDPVIKAKYPSYSKCANNINCFKDYFEGMSYAKEVNKPVMLDFTGYGCVNCRKTEEHIWVDDRIRAMLNDSVVLISLYVDDDKKLSSIYISEHSGKKIRNVGNKWADFQIVNFQQNSQPLYVMATNDQKVISKPRPFAEGIDGYLYFLKCSLTENRKINLNN